MKTTYFFLFLFLMQYALAQSNWHLQKNENGIKIFTAESTSSPVKSVKAEIDINQSIEKVAAAIMNVALYKEWIYSCIESQLIKKVNDTVVIYRHITDAPWPFEDRDQVSQFTLTRNRENGYIYITSLLQTDYPEQKGFIRIKNSNERSLLIPQKNRTVKAIYNLNFDPAGNIPSWLMNIFITDGPYKSFVNLKNRLDS
jgi:hypothetical protein